MAKPASIDPPDPLEPTGPDSPPPERVKLPRIPAGPVYCNGIVRAGDKYCRKPMGERTPHEGYGRCFLHGGCAPSSVALATRQQAQEAMIRLGRPTPIGSANPVLDLLGALCECKGNVLAYRELLDRQAIGDDPNLTGLDHLGDEQVRPIVKLYNEERRDLFRIAAECVKLGLTERQVRATEDQVETFRSAWVAAIEDPAAGLDAVTRTTLRRVMVTHLRRLSALTFPEGIPDGPVGGPGGPVGGSTGSDGCERGEAPPGPQRGF